MSTGFTLLEALVAITLTGAVLVPFYGVLSNSLSSTGRIGQRLDEVEVQHNALALAHVINPAQQPSGTLDTADGQYTWSSETVRALKTGSGYPRGPSRFRVGFYDVDVVFTGAETNGPPVTMTVPVAGYQSTVAPSAFSAQP